MTTIPDLFDRERDRLVADLAGLTDEQWRTPSLCAGWTVRDLTAHLLLPHELRVPTLLRELARSRFSFDRAADRLARTDPRDTDALLDGLRSLTHGNFRAPGPEAGPLCHLVIHGQDLRRPLGLDHAVEPDSARVVLGELTDGKRARALVRKAGIDDLRLVATDADWSRGDGRTVEGTAAAIITTITGRPAALAELTGDGVQLLRSRTGSG